jgi:hypothetical protein
MSTESSSCFPRRSGIAQTKRTNEPLLSAIRPGLVRAQLREHDSPLRGFLSKWRRETRWLSRTPKKNFCSPGTTYHDITEIRMRARLCCLNTPLVSSKAKWNAPEQSERIARSRYSCSMALISQRRSSSTMEECANMQAEDRNKRTTTRLTIVQLYSEFAPTLAHRPRAVSSPPVLVEP